MITRMGNPYRDRLLSVSSISRRSGDQVREGTGRHGRFKEVTDEHGNVFTYHAEGDRKDVVIKPERVTSVSGSSLERKG